jgi:hypothetical protein
MLARHKIKSPRILYLQGKTISLTENNGHVHKIVRENTEAKTFPDGTFFHEVFNHLDKSVNHENKFEQVYSASLVISGGAERTQFEWCGFEPSRNYLT